MITVPTVQYIHTSKSATSPTHYCIKRMLCPPRQLDSRWDFLSRQRNRFVQSDMESGRDSLLQVPGGQIDHLARSYSCLNRYNLWLFLSWDNFLLQGPCMGLQTTEIIECVLKEPRTLWNWTGPVENELWSFFVAYSPHGYNTWFQSCLLLLW